MPVLIDSEGEPRLEDFALFDALNNRLTGESHADYIAVQAVISWTLRGAEWTIKTGKRIARAVLIPFIVD